MPVRDWVILVVLFVGVAAAINYSFFFKKSHLDPVGCNSTFDTVLVWKKFGTERIRGAWILDSLILSGNHESFEPIECDLAQPIWYEHETKIRQLKDVIVPFKIWKPHLTDTAYVLKDNQIVLFKISCFDTLKDDDDNFWKLIGLEE